MPAGHTVGAQFHAVWDRTGPTYGAVHDDVLDKLAAAGVQAVRIDVAAQAFNPSPGTYVARPYGGKMEDTLTALRSRDMKALIVLNETPVFAHPAFTGTKALPDSPSYYTGIGKWFTEYLAPWNDALLGVEVFNEANLAGPGGFDQAVTTPRPEHYADCLRAYYDAAKSSSNPQLPVVFGAPESISVDPTKDASTPKTNFIGLAYARVRATTPGRFPWDVMAVHVYPAAARYSATDDWVAFYRHLAALRARQRAEGDTTPWYITESGHSAHENVGTPQAYETAVTEAQQGTYIVEDLDGVARDYPEVRLHITYNAWEKGDPATSTAAAGLTLQATRHQYGFGVLRFADRGTGKPVYAAIQARQRALGVIP